LAGGALGKPSAASQGFNGYLIQAFALPTGRLTKGCVQALRDIPNGILHALIVCSAGTTCKLILLSLKEAASSHTTALL